MAARIVVLISGTGSNMQALIHACRDGEVPAEVVAVVADRHCSGIDVAAALDVETSVVGPADFDDRARWNEAMRAAIAAYKPDLVVSAGFMRILSPAVVDEFHGRLINLHPSLLPAFPGAHAVRDALAAGATTTGSTVHFVDHEVDHGPVILQEEVPVERDDDERSLHERIKAIEHRLLPQACRLLLEGKARLESDRVVISEA